MKQRGVYCLETVWFDPDSSLSMRPMLELMQSFHDTPFVHRNAVSKPEFFYFLEAWLDTGSREERYPILVLSYHGAEGSIVLRDDPEEIDWDDEATYEDRVVTLDEIADCIEGRCKNKILHFASCSTVDVNNNKIVGFIESSGLSAVSGYTEDIEWMDSMAFELLYMHSIQSAPRVNLTPRIMDGVNSLLWEEPYTQLNEAFGFNMRIRAEPAQ